MPYFYSEKGLVKMRLIAKIYEIYDKYYATVNTYATSESSV